MANEYRYKLQKGGKKSLCPECGNKTFVRYIDSNTGELLPEQYGRCDRESKCSFFATPPPEIQETKCLFVAFNKINDYSAKAFQIIVETKMFYLPKSTVFEVIETGCYVSEWYLINTDKPPNFLNNDCRFYLKGERIDKPQYLKNKGPVLKHKSVCFPVDIFKQTLQGYDKNVFIQNLLNNIPFPFEVKDIEMIISQYYLGTICDGYRAGAITFPFIDKNEKIRAVQVKQFDSTNHTTGTDFLHSIIEKHHQKRNESLPEWLNAYKSNDKTVSCLFGEHLLNKYPLCPVALVEAPKTAVYCSLYFGFPESPGKLLWLAVYNLSSLNIDKCRALQGRDVYLFPDLSKDGKAYELWSNKASELTKGITGTSFTVSDLLETFAPAELKENGADIADVLIKLDWRKFRITETLQKQTLPEPETTAIPKSEKSEKGEALKQTYFFKNEPLPKAELLTYANIQKEKPGFEKVGPQELQKLTKTYKSWEQEIKDLEIFFSETTIKRRKNAGKTSIKLNHCSTITNVPLFIESHFATLRANNGNEIFMPFLKRLQTLKKIMLQKN